MPYHTVVVIYSKPKRPQNRVKLTEAKMGVCLLCFTVLKDVRGAVNLSKIQLEKHDYCTCFFYLLRCVSFQTAPIFTLLSV